MSWQCPYRHLSHSSFRLYIYCRLFLPAAEWPNNSSHCRRNLSSCKTRSNKSPRSTNLSGPSTGTAKPPLRTHSCASLPSDRAFSSDSQSHNDHTQASQSPKSDSSSETPMEATESNSRRSGGLIRSPVQIRKGRSEAKRETRPETPSSVRNALKHNPWAAILSSPPRECSVTHARVPRDLLIKFSLVKHPDASSLWFMPTELLGESLQDLEKQGSKDSEQEIAHRKALPSTRVTNSPWILGLRKLLKPTSLPRLFRTQLRHPTGPINQKDQKQMVWRQDMTDFVLTKLREHAIDQLKRSSVSSRSRKLAPSAWQVIDTGHDPTVQQLERSLDKLGDLDNMTWGGVLVLGSIPDEPAEPTGKAHTTPCPDGSSMSKVEQAQDTQVYSESGDPEGTTQNTDTVASAGENATPEVEQIDGSHSYPTSDQLGQMTQDADLAAMSDESATPDTEGVQDTHFPDISERYLPDVIQLPNHEAKAPIFDLRRLLSESDVDELRSFHPVFQHNALFFRPFKHVSEKPLVALWQVKLHMMDAEHPPP